MSPSQIDFGKNVHLGDRVFINHNLILMSIGGVTIGDGTFIGPNVSIVTDNHVLEDTLVLRCQPVKVGQKVWIGEGVKIMPGVSIGDGAVLTRGVVVTSHNGNQTFKQEGHEAIELVFANFLAPFDTDYHLNGQQVVTIDEDKATGTAYCHVVLIGPNQEEKRIQTTQGVCYDDEYVEVSGQWKIAKRTSYFMYMESNV
ncbi:nuclear transport factor 2 family protein [Streptococcus pantholopis]|uniref:nuclear transport factor 2 family protein n=1 Tax=Streptococcus pantholopis TaxID=1811193 RepID=UPI000B16F716|nr:nuclear transport factor 2 family protein [Streptococcus pantholopis]